MARADVIAGISVAGLLLPEAVAYASIAGLEPARAITAAVAGCLAYAAIGRSRFAIVSPTSSSAAILAAALAAIPDDPAMRGALATAAVAIAGALFLIAAALRLGALTSLIARPVLRGFALGIAVTIILRQLPAITGVPAPGGNLLRLIGQQLGAIGAWHGASVATGALALALLMALRRMRGVPAAFIVLALGIAASMLLDLPARGVRTVGAIAIAPGLLTIPALTFREASQLAQLVVPLALILFAESWGTMRALALRHGDTIEPDRELAAIGGANLAAALVQGMPVGAGFSAGSASEAAGAASRWTSVFAAVALALLAWFGRPAIAHLPDAVLAAVVIAALTHALSPAPFVHLWKIGRDEMVAFAAAASVLAFGVLDGMLIAIGLSLAALIQRMAAPHRHAGSARRRARFRRSRPPPGCEGGAGHDDPAPRAAIVLRQCGAGDGRGRTAAGRRSRAGAEPGGKLRPRQHRARLPDRVRRAAEARRHPLAARARSRSYPRPVPPRRAGHARRAEQLQRRRCGDGDKGK